MDIGSGLERFSRDPFEQVLDPSGIGLAFAARGDDGSVGVLGQASRSGAADGDQPGRLAEQVDDQLEGVGR